jgi:aryl-alcohol dehydrogenase-like predicted oxidoreductase
VVAEARNRRAAHAGGTRHRLRPVQPAGQGFLTGTINDKTGFDSSDTRTTIPRFAAEARQANQVLIDLLTAIAGRTLHRLDENLGAVNVELTSADRDEIETAAAGIQIQGARYPEHLERLTGQ